MERNTALNLYFSAYSDTNVSSGCTAAPQNTPCEDVIEWWQHSPKKKKWERVDEEALEERPWHLKLGENSWVSQEAAVEKVKDTVTEPMCADWTNSLHTGTLFILSLYL